MVIKALDQCFKAIVTLILGSTHGQDVRPAQLPDVRSEQEAGGAGAGPHQDAETRHGVGEAGGRPLPCQGGGRGQHVGCHSLNSFHLMMILTRLKMTVMDRLVAELGGIESAILALQDQVRHKM